jgi:Uma2 family endonuclease
MIAMPAPSHEPTAPDHLLTVAEYAALGETEPGYSELVEGRLLMSPSPTPKHNIAAFELAVQLREQVPASLRVVLDVDVDLELDTPDQPGFSRRPDLIIVERAALNRVNREGGLLRASAVHVVIELVSPGSSRTDKIHKRAEYEEAGIPWYWIVDLVDPVSLVACRLGEEGGYRDAARVTGTFTASEPFPVTVDLDGLR